MSFLPVMATFVFDGAITAPVADGGKRIVDGRGRDGPMLQNHGLKRGEPFAAAGRHGACRRTHRLRYGDKVGVIGKVHVDLAHAFPQLPQLLVVVSSVRFP